MDKHVGEVVGMIEKYLWECADMPLENKPAPEEIELQITSLLVDNKLVDKTFTIEVVPLDNSYILRPRNQYTSIIIGGMPMFCSKCGKLLGKTPCTHEQPI